MLNIKTATGGPQSQLASRITAMSRRPASLGAVPAGAVSLAMGEPFSGTPDHIGTAAIDAIRRGRTRYEALTGAATLKAAIAAHLGRRHGNSFEPDHIVPTHGASAGLAATILAVVDPGDRVVIPEPTYSLYADHVAMAGGEVVWVANNADGSLNVDALAGALTGAALLILCSPGNPSGQVIERPVLEELSSIARQADALLLSDEAYSDILFDGRTFFSALDLDDNSHVICCRTFSKSYAMTGWRLGYVVAPAPIAAAINLVHRTFNGALNTFVQDAGIEALATPQGEIDDLVAEYQVRRDIVVDALTGLEGVTFEPSSGAFYAWVRVRMGISSDELVEQMAAAGVLVRSGREYGPSGEGAFRISFAADIDNLREGLRRVVSVLGKIVR